MAIQKECERTVGDFSTKEKPGDGRTDLYRETYLREKIVYIAEILSADIVWVINEQRRLISIHQTMEEANYYCQKHFQVQPVIVDRRPENTG